MASVIILIYGERRHLVPKPADYESLLDVAHAKFPELYDFGKHEIAFHVKPEWFDGEVELDRKAFAEVRDREVIRINTAPSATGQLPRSNFKIQGDSVEAILPYEMILLRGWMKLDFIYIPTGRKVTYAIKSNQNFRRLMAHMATLLEFDRIELYFDGEKLETDDTPQDMGMYDYEIIELHDLP